MKIVFSFLATAILALMHLQTSARTFLDMGSVLLNDTIVFDLSQAEFSTSGSTSYIEFPVFLRSDDPAINAVDYWFQFDLTKLTYVSTTSLISTLDVYSNFNSNNLFLSNTSSTTSISVYLPVEVPIMKLKFGLSNPCDEILNTDFYTSTTLINGLVSSALFVAPNPADGIQVLSPDPLCANDSIDFTYGSTFNGVSITSYEWDFGNSSTATGQNVSGLYNSDGTYIVTLNVTTADGCSHSMNAPVTILPSPVVSFTSSYDNAQNLVSFTNLTTISSGSIDSFSWEFGDNSSTDGFEPTHTYPSTGIYEASLTATSDLGCTTTFSDFVNASNSILELKSMEGLFEMYPNPVSDQLNIQTIQPLNFIVMDATGRRVMDESNIGRNTTKMISVDQLADGLYMLVGYNDAYISTKRFEVRH